MPIAFLYCDLAGVHYDFQTGLTKLLENEGITYASFANDIEPLEKKLNEGSISLDQALPSYERYFHHSLAKKEFINFLTDQFQPITAMHTVLQNLSKHYPIGLLTNIFDGLFSVLQKKHLIASLDYQQIIQSYQVGVVKPDPRIYLLATKKAQVNPEQILFIDDSPVSVAAANQVGWNTILFDVKRVDTIREEIAAKL